MKSTLQSACLGLASLYACQGCGDGGIQVHLVSTVPIALVEPARLKVQLWGYDTTIADQDASLLQEYTDTLPSIPRTYSLRYHESLAGKIAPQASGPFSYYLTFYADGNGDGVVGPGDLRQDYSAAPPRFQPTMGGLSGDYFIQVCEPTFPARPW